MERKNETVSALSIQLSTACVFATAVYWITRDEGVGTIFPLALLPYAPVLYGLNRLYLRRERSLQRLVLLNLCLGLACFAVLAADVGWGRWTALALAAVCCLWLTSQGCEMALNPPDLSRAVLCLDLSLVVLLFSVAYGAMVQVSIYQLAPACVGCASALLGLMIRRMGGGIRARGWIFVAGAFLGVVALVFLAVEFVAAPAGQGLVSLWNALIAAVRTIGTWVGKFLTWLLSLVPPPEGDAMIGAEPPPAAMFNGEEEMQVNPAILVVLIALLAVGALCLAVWILRRLGRIRVGGGSVVGAAASRRKRNPLGKGLRRLFSSWAAYFRMRLWLIRHRDTPEGLFYLLVRRCRMVPWHKRQGETPREFLLRLRNHAAADPTLAAALEELIPAVDAALFAPPGRTGAAPQSRLIRRRIGATVRRQFVRDGRNRRRTRREPAEKTEGTGARPR